jgi:cytidylate kinase
MPIITISRGICSGGTQLAKLLQTKLDWPVLSQEDVSAAAAKAYRVSREELERGLYMPASFYERFTSRKTRYLLATQATIAGLLADGNGIYHGLAGQFLFKGLRNAFKVRIVAPMDLRVENAVHRMGVTRDEATRRIHEADDHRLLWGRQIFDADVNDPDLYDLVVNLEKVSLATAANLVADVMRGRDRRPTSESVREFDDFALEKKIKAELFFNSPFTPDIARVSVRRGEVYLTGGRAFEEIRPQLVEFTRQLPGVTDIHSDHGIIDAVDISLDPGATLLSGDAKATDVMLDLEHYPNCWGTCTIREAVVALSASSIRLDDDHFVLPRYLLIRDADQNLAGVVSRRELLRGLVPHLRADRESAAHIQTWVPFGGTTPSELFIRWRSFFSKAAIDASRESIKSIMVPIRGTVQADDSLSTVISTMLFHGIDLVAVLEGTKVVGVVLMTSIFDIVAQFVMEHGGDGTGGGEKGGDHD